MTEGHDILIRHLLTMTDAPAIALPNGKGKELPRYVVQAAGGGQRTADLGGMTEASPEIVVRVETKSGNGTAENSALVQKLIDHFPVGLTVENLEILAAPLVRPALPGTPYAVPVIIRGRFHF